MAPSPKGPMIGTTVGHFRVVGQLGRGASGTVYKAVDETLDREVALKVLHQNGVDPAAVERFRAEATILARLHHPGIATVYEFFVEDGGLVMAMECLRGETLDRLADRVGPMPLDRAVALTRHILAALGHAHDAGILHRDMKPANVMVNDDDVKIMDFGIARVLAADDTVRTEGLQGTPGYMAPEQVLGQALDARADLYAVGTIFYRLLTGRLPFDGETPEAILQRQVGGAPTPLRLHRPDLPAWCTTVMNRALAKAPADRFPSADAFRDALKSTKAKRSNAAADRTSTTRSAYKGVGLAIAMTSLGLLAFGALRRPPTMPLTLPATPQTTPETTLLSARVTALAVGSIVTPPARMMLLSTEPVPQQEVAAMPDDPGTRSWQRLEFDTRALVSAGSKEHERDAKLVLGDSRIAVKDADAGEQLYSVPYESVTSIAYSHSRDPLWLSPTGPAPIVHAPSGVFRALGIAVDRRWISLTTKTDVRFIVLRVDEAQVTKLLSALQRRTRLSPHRLVDSKAKPNL